MVFIQLIRHQMALTLEFLSTVPGPTGTSALDYVLTEWCNKQSSFFGSYETKARYCIIRQWAAVEKYESYLLYIKADMLKWPWVLAPKYQCVVRSLVSLTCLKYPETIGNIHLSQSLFVNICIFRELRYVATEFTDACRVGDFRLALTRHPHPECIDTWWKKNKR